MLILITLAIAVLLSGVCGLLAAVTGAGGSKSLRRVVVPIITTLFGLACLNSFWTIILMLRAAVLSQGYGVPDETDPKGSALGTFWMKVLKNKLKADIFTRGTLGLQEATVLLIVPILTGVWILWTIFSVLIIWNYIWFGALHPNGGRFKMFGLELIWDEVEVHGINSFVWMLLILFSR